MKSIGLILLFIGVQPFCYSQIRITSGGNLIPKEFRKANLLEINKLIEDETSIGKTKDRKSFHLSNNYFLNELYNSGDVIFNNKITSYMNEIVSDLLIHDQKTRKNIEIYLFRSTVPNAFTTIDGGIFIHIGLISRMQNKDELAFVIAHEIGHYIKGHQMKRFKNNDLVENEYKRKDKGAELKKTLKKLSFSRENEMEADIIGLSLFENSNYSWKALSPIFLLLKQSDLPIYKCDLSPLFLESKNLNVIDSIFLDGHSPKDLNKLDDDDVEFSTHPSADARIKILLERAIKKNSETYIDDGFKKISEQCLFETMCLYNEDFDFFSGLYYARFLLQQFPDNQTANYELIRSLYGISKFRSAGRKDYLKPQINHRYNAFFYNCYDFLRKKANAVDVCAIAIESAKTYLTKHAKKSDEINAIIKDLSNDYQTLQGSLSHRLVNYKFNHDITTEQNDQIIIHYFSDSNTCSMKINANAAFFEPIYLPNLEKADSDPNLYIKTIQDRKRLIKHIESDLLTENIKMLDTKTMGLTQFQNFKDAITIDRFYYESHLGYILNSYVSRYSNEINEIAERTEVEQVAKIHFETTYTLKPEVNYHCSFIELKSGKLIFSYNKNLKSNLTFNNAENQLKKILNSAQKKAKEKSS
tara:strand:+ start:235 stop:2160 length:1926 start_codon:yes stop_codon:yes gene_type:complete